MYERIPNELKTLNQWVCVSEGSKIPKKAWVYESASAVDRATWSDFDMAVESVDMGMYQGIGFVFNDTGIVGIDIDDGFDEDGFMTAKAADIIGACRSYTEISRSGRGFHIIVRGNLPFKGRNNLAGVEIYRTCRYFILTGNTALYNTIETNQEAIDYVVGKYFAEAKDIETESTSVNRMYAPIWPKCEERIRIKPTYPKIPDGSRNVCLTSLAGMLHNMGYNRQQIYDELAYANAKACEPPLTDQELITISKSVTRYRKK